MAGAHSRDRVAMLSIPAGIRIWLVAGFTDMRRGLDGLSALVQTELAADVLSGC
jgi:transposase